MSTASQPSAVEVEAAMAVLYRLEPGAAESLWRSSFDFLSSGLEHSRAIRDRARLCVVAIIAAAAIAVLFFFPPTQPSDITDQASLTPMMAEVGWIPHELQLLFLAVSIGIFAAEYSLTRMFPVLAKEDSIVSLLRYYGSKVHDEETSL